MEYIKKKHVIDATWFEPVYSDPLNVLTELRERLNELPTVDAVPVVRCKDCKYFEKYKYGDHLGLCHNKDYGDGWGNYPPPIKSEGGYCDWAERKEE